jgi:fructokinase
MAHEEARVIIGIETGGTTVVCATATVPQAIIDVETLPTTTPGQTLDRVGAFIARHRRQDGVEAVGIGAFGPLDLDPDSPTFGVIGVTPKQGWEGVRILDRVREAAGCPVALETDVTAAAMGEQRWGAGAGLTDLAYVTVGTGIGVGALVQGRPLHGLGHPEAGHLTVRRHPHDEFAGVCRLHGDCLEGLASGPAIAARWGRPGEALGDRAEPAVAMEAYYLAQLTTALLYILSPGRIILGGGVMQLPGLLDAVRTATVKLLGRALGHHPASDPASGFLARPGLGRRAGVVGALTMAADLARNDRQS